MLFFSRKLSLTGYCLTLYDPLNRCILDILPSRHKYFMTNYFAKIPIIERKKVKYVSMDMWETYKDERILGIRSNNSYNRVRKPRGNYKK